MNVKNVAGNGMLGNDGRLSPLILRIIGGLSSYYNYLCNLYIPIFLYSL